MSIYQFLNRFPALTVAMAMLCTVSTLQAALKPYKAKMYSPAETIDMMEVAEGYRVELVAAEPMIEEPAVMEWDGNGKLYVAEMLTYMQDIDGKNQLEPRSRVTLLEDTNWDGVMDKSTVFIDKLILPRMLLALEDRVIVRETGTFDLYSYRDTDGDGVADEKIKVFEGGPRGGNLEHQPSGLVWAIDNWVYTTYSNHRFRWKGDKFIKQALPAGSGQFGLSQDDIGKLYYSTAGGEMPAMDFQQPIVYGRIRMQGELADGFRVCWPIDDIPDTQGGRGRVRADNTLNWFTGVAGQSIFRGTALPADFYGNLIIPEPVGRLVRRAVPKNEKGKTVLHNYYDKEEFIACKDPNFRPVNSNTGPDGTLYIADMYRGIIQEGNWVRPGSYLRGVVEAYGLDKNIGKGRIYRVMHTTTKRGKRPQMLKETSAQLVAHLSHANGWWRDQAQRLLVFRQDQSVVPALKELATNGSNPLGRLHALWTLEGLGIIDASLLSNKLSDPDWRVRAGAIRISEQLPSESLAKLQPQFLKAAKDKNPNVAIQLALSVQYAKLADSESLLNVARDAHPDSDALKHVVNVYFSEIEKRRLAELQRQRQNETERKRTATLDAGKKIYTTLCFHCHGEDGKGMPIPKEGLADIADKPNIAKTLAPSLINSPRVTGHKDNVIRIVLHGLTGEINGKTYIQHMVPMESNGDEFIANVLSYVRNEWGHKASMIEAGDVKEVRTITGKREEPWTLAELAKLAPPPQAVRNLWKVTASHGNGSARSAIDGNNGSRYSTGTSMRPGMWYQIELPSVSRIKHIHLDTTGSGLDWPVSYEVHVSSDGESWGTPIVKGVGNGPKTDIRFSPVKTKFIRITQTGARPGKHWSIHEMALE